MRQFKVVALAGSGSAVSKTAAVAGYVTEKLRSPTIETSNISLRGGNLEAMLDYPTKDEWLLALNELVLSADGLVIATPIYKASFSGLLKLYLDQLPQFALAGKAVLPIATGGSLAHVLALDFSLRPVLQSMGVRHAVQSCFMPDSRIGLGGDRGAVIGPEERVSLDEAIHHFRESIITADAGGCLGHPRPERRVAG